MVTHFTVSGTWAPGWRFPWCPQRKRRGYSYCYLIIVHLFYDLLINNWKYDTLLLFLFVVSITLKIHYFVVDDSHKKKTTHNHVVLVAREDSAFSIRALLQPSFNWVEQSDVVSSRFCLFTPTSNPHLFHYVQHPSPPTLAVHLNQCTSSCTSFLFLIQISFWKLEKICFLTNS